MRGHRCCRALSRARQLPSRRRLFSRGCGRFNSQQELHSTVTAATEGECVTDTVRAGAEGESDPSQATGLGDDMRQKQVCALQ